MRWSSHAQQAPSPVHSSPVTPLKSAWNSAHPSIGGTMRHSNSSAATVSIVFSQLENRLARIQPITPMVVTGAGRPGSMSARLRWNARLAGAGPAASRSLIVPDDFIDPDGFTVQPARCDGCTSS